MSDKKQKVSVLARLKQSKKALSLPEISALMGDIINERTLRRWLVASVEAGVIKRSGQKRGTRYAYIPAEDQNPSHALPFLAFIPEQRRPAILAQIRDLWTHSSTALEGNTLTLGDTHAVLTMGLTVSGKPLSEHQEIVGHAKAIDLLYKSLQQPLTKELIFELHKAVQTEIIHDIFKPLGAWKVEINGTYAVTSQGKQLFIEYAPPMYVDELMSEVINTINDTDTTKINTENAIKHYAKIHMAIAHIHPFFDGNGRLARLISNIILLKAGLPPLVIEKSKRREYIECLADYQVKVGQLSNNTGVWPNEKVLKDFEMFCEDAYQATKELIENGKGGL